nr:hypothetical protein [uncultured Actinoplanes sp.]
MNTHYPIARRIPDDQPFVVRPHLGKRVALAAGITGALSLFLLCLLGLAAAGEQDADVTGLLGVWLFLTLLLAAVFGGLMWLRLAGGPVLAAGPEGLWIRTRQTPGQAIWLPWSHIERISRRRWYFDRMLVVHPMDRRLQDNLGDFTLFDAGLARSFHGSGFTAAVNFADRTEAEILQAVAWFAANRVVLA